MSPKSIKPPERIPNKRQAHLSHITILLISRPNLITRILLWNILNRKVLCIDTRFQLRFEWRGKTAKLVKINAGEEGMLLDFCSAAVAAESVVGVADETGVGKWLVGVSSEWIVGID